MKYTENEQAAIVAVGDAGEQGLPHGEVNGRIRNALTRKKQLLGRIREDGRVRLTARGRKVYERLRGAPAGWEKVEVYGHTSHIGRVREVKELGKRFLRVDVPSYTSERRLYPSRTYKLSPTSIFRRTELTESEAREKLSYQSPTGDGTPLPGLRLAEARERIGGYSLRRAEAAVILGLDPEEYLAIEGCTATISEAYADELIARLAAAWQERVVTGDLPDDVKAGLARHAGDDEQDRDECDADFDLDDVGGEG